MCSHNKKNRSFHPATYHCLFEVSLDPETLNTILTSVLKIYRMLLNSIFFSETLSKLMNFSATSIIDYLISLHLQVSWTLCIASQTALLLLTDSHCAFLFLWQMSCSVAIFNWQICQLCINLCKLPRLYLVPEIAPGLLDSIQCLSQWGMPRKWLVIGGS